jgi:hypothetical protein
MKILAAVERLPPAILTHFLLFVKCFLVPWKLKIRFFGQLQFMQVDAILIANQL